MPTWVRRITRGETALDPNTPENRERWNTSHVNNHESLFPFSDNLITLMFVVASDLSEAQSKRLTSSVSLKGLNITAVRTTFLELFCTMENPSLRVRGHVRSMNRNFIIKDNAEDDFGHWAKEEVTGEQGHVNDERTCFWTWDNTECAWQFRPSKGRQV